MSKNNKNNAGHKIDMRLFLVFDFSCDPAMICEIFIGTLVLRLCKNNEFWFVFFAKYKR